MSDQPTPKPTPIVGYFAGEDHALKTGMFIGTLMRAGVMVHIQTDDQGNYTSKMMVELPPLEELQPPVEVWIRVLAGPGAL